MITRTKSLLALFILSAVTFSCSSDDSSTVENPADVSYVLAYQTNDWDTYIWQFESLDEIMTGDINMVGKGIEQAASAGVPVGNTFFALSGENEGSVGYYLNAEGKLVTNKNVFTGDTYAYGTTDDDKLILVNSPWDASSTQNELIIYDPATASITNRKFNDFAIDNGHFLWPTSVNVSGNRVFVSTFERDAAWKLYNGNATVKVYEYPSLTYLKTISDSRTTTIGQYYTNTGMVQTESGDIYTFSSNSRTAGYTATSGHSGILRIKKGQSEFDTSYFFDIEASTLKGRVLSAYPVGGEKVLINYIPADIDAAQGNWSFLNYGTFKFKSAILDLSAKSITQVTNLPDHAGDNYYGFGSAYTENGKTYKSFVTNDEGRVYQIDVNTGVAVKGAVITGGVNLPAITKLTKKK
ncbi:hypothetical protein HNP37_000383 [Flavobacterium nitrogenifigens]|uniref:DUF4374 domain-containing protein n=2 Tax=Flavobacterium TaxID=237 RepID=A0A7W7N6E8_9FLAO|nr:MULTISPECIES: DUF4374 domain-containing protein [Flavobacterium]MBB4800344.1 hypothetical protein [Flavobacterium nitrogenifigens]MBB6385906.1 hypothetical protein [Flavobacterium notoginsengisoli]